MSAKVYSSATHTPFLTVEYPHNGKEVEFFVSSDGTRDVYDLFVRAQR